MLGAGASVSSHGEVNRPSAMALTSFASRNLRKICYSPATVQGEGESHDGS
jgi:hypothetical protein